MTTSSAPCSPTHAHASVPRDGSPIPARSSSSFRNRGRNPILELGCGLKLVDLGVARLRRFEEPHAVEAPGTRSYIAPELFTGTLADEASDIFALGVTLYRMFSGGGYPYGESSLSVARTSL